MSCADFFYKSAVVHRMTTAEHNHPSPTATQRTATCTEHVGGDRQLAYISGHTKKGGHHAASTTN